MSGPGRILETRFPFDSAREAIDAVSRFEEWAESDYDYDIQMSDQQPFPYYVTLYESGEPGKRVHLGFVGQG